MLFKITEYCGIICLGTRMPPTWRSKYECGLIIIMFWCDTVCYEGHYILKLMHFEPTLWSWRFHSHHRVYIKSFIIIWCYYAWTFCYVKSSFFWDETYLSWFKCTCKKTWSLFRINLLFSFVFIRSCIF